MTRLFTQTSDTKANIFGDGASDEKSSRTSKPEINFKKSEHDDPFDPQINAQWGEEPPVTIDDDQLPEATRCPCPYLRVFVPEDAKTKLNEAGVDLTEDSVFGSSHGTATAAQVHWWRKIQDDRDAGWRRLPIGHAEHLVALEALKLALPNFRTLVDLVHDAVAGSINARAPVRLPPVLLVGPPGIGKSHAAEQLAVALGEPCVAVSMTTTTGVNPLGGTDPVWRTPRIGIVADALIVHGSASPILFLDEVDKPFAANSSDRPLDPLHALLEPQTARAFKDELLEIAFDASAVIWIATANDATALAPSILDRFLVLEIEAPDPRQMSVMIRALLAKAYTRWPNWFEPTISEALIDHLATLYPRRLRQVIEISCARAAAMGERRLAQHHINHAIALLESGSKSPKFGFRD